MTFKATLLVSTLLLAINLSFVPFSGSKDRDLIPKIDTIQVSGDNLLQEKSADTTKIVEKWETIYEKTGASWYGIPYHGRRTASGVIYNMHELTFARQVKLSKVFTFGESYKVTNIANGKSVMVVCNDTGPLKPGRSIDLSKQAMTELDGIHAGVIQVKIEKLVE